MHSELLVCAIRCTSLELLAEQLKGQGLLLVCTLLARQWDLKTEYGMLLRYCYTQRSDANKTYLIRTLLRLTLEYIVFGDDVKCEPCISYHYSCQSNTTDTAASDNSQKRTVHVCAR
jgi:hypothetical protein